MPATQMIGNIVANPNLEVRGLCAAYGSRIVLKDISLSLPAGEWFALVGPNGSGKSTLLDCIVGKLRPTSGEISIAGHSILIDTAKAKQLIGYACAPEVLPPLLTARQCFEVHVGAKGLLSVDADVMTLAEDFKFLPYLESFVDTLSLGTKQKLAILLGLVGDPRLIILDEAFNGLDPTSSLTLKRHLRWRIEERRATLILATHALDIVDHYADCAGLLLDGILAREWSKTQIDRMRLAGRGFETALNE
ncbi:MAG: ABC transporter ATP-binding protein [Paraburkholderia sp.]|uniref:ABC transporter ATP-binding protein n=1 Tax=Paraburkholderia sp. TaxID=1926495 RepID=UPI003C32A249